MKVIAVRKVWDKNWQGLNMRPWIIWTTNNLQNSVKWLSSPWVFVAKWIERPTQSSGVHGFDFCRVLRFCHCPTFVSDMLINSPFKRFYWPSIFLLCCTLSISTWQSFALPHPFPSTQKTLLTWFSSREELFLVRLCGHVRCGGLVVSRATPGSPAPAFLLSRAFFSSRQSRLIPSALIGSGAVVSLFTPSGGWSTKRVWKIQSKRLYQEWRNKCCIKYYTK